MDPHVALLAAVTFGIGYLMVVTGMGKNMLEPRRRHRRCPSCGRDADTACRCF